MKKHLLAIALFALCTTGLNAASPKKVAPEKKGVETINRATAEAHIGFLACDELEGREAGWKGGRIAGNYIISCLKQMERGFGYIDYLQPIDFLCFISRKVIIGMGISVIPYNRYSQFGERAVVAASHRIVPSPVVRG